MREFKITETPIETETFAGDAEKITATWEGRSLVLRADTVTAEGYSVPVRITVDAALVRWLVHDITAATAITEPARGAVVTKWDLIDRVERAVLDATRTYGHDGGYIACSECGTTLPTEGDFARHFTVPDRRYKGLGYCPIRLAREDAETRAAKD